MSLTSELAHSDSLISTYLHAQVPILAALGRGHPLRKQVTVLLGLDRLPQTLVHPSPVPPSNRHTIGTAFDYRVRLHFERLPVTSLVASLGVPVLCQDDRTATTLLAEPMGADEEGVVQFFRDYEAMVESLAPAGQRLPRADEEELVRYCYVLALFEQLARAGLIPDSPLARVDLTRGTAGMLALASADAISDLAALSSDLAEDALPFVDLHLTNNPVFSGSAHVGGADADFLLDDILFELKTVSQVTISTVRDWLRQLVGYVLLDYQDARHIRSLALWLPRYRWIIRYPLGLFVLPLTKVLTGDTAINDESALSAALAVLRRPLETALLEQRFDRTLKHLKVNQPGNDGLRPNLRADVSGS